MPVSPQILVTCRLLIAAYLLEWKYGLLVFKINYVEFELCVLYYENPESYPDIIDNRRITTNFVVDEYGSPSRFTSLMTYMMPT